MQFSVLSDSISVSFGSSSDGTPADADRAKLFSSQDLTPNLLQQHGLQPQTHASPMQLLFSRSPKRHVPDHEIHYKTPDGATAIVPSGDLWKGYAMRTSTATCV